MASSGIAKLSEQVLVDGIGETYISGLFRDSYGELHDGCLKLAAGDERESDLQCRRRLHNPFRKYRSR